ncbi:(d)CMP kinase [Lentibacillus sp. JNUCC-1]|uniref:(d)CMP kinase n=1 Tax=Lentibacillus sp. JNUCC-1 TaxID=2654513 RepID=UPI0012E84902|nr:(d)CMP kinase [Lentibacillus sp. JNUCC-1]MUV39762.1 (d)CMP kinase [Lentibacillus sp. JNUCC-1]
MNENNIAIAIDGPAAAGKSTVAKIVAHRLSYIYIDTGAMYRALTLSAIEQSMDVRNEQKLNELLLQTDIVLEQEEDGQHVFVNGKDVTFDIRTDQVSNQVSHVAAHPAVRHEMVRRQKEMATKRCVVMDGRDIGTHVIPDAEVKIFLVASVEERAKRRYEENVNKGIPADFDRLKQEIIDRDLIDSQREISPLIKADDAIEINTTSLSIQEVADRILTYAEQRIQA